MFLFFTLVAYFLFFSISMLALSPISAMITIWLAVWIIYTNMEEGDGSANYFFINIMVPISAACVIYLILSHQIRLQWTGWYVIFIGILLVFSWKREDPMIPAVYFFFLSAVISVIEHCCFGISGAVSIWSCIAIAVALYYFLFLRRSHINETDLFYIVKIPLLPVHYIHQLPRLYTKAVKFRKTDTLSPPERCDARAELVREEVRKLIGKMDGSKTYLIETHQGLLNHMNRYVKINEIVNLPGFPNKTKGSFKSIYQSCHGCTSYTDKENGCRYSYEKKRSTRIVLFRPALK